MISRLTPSELHDLAVGVVTNRIFLANKDEPVENAFGAIIRMCGGKFHDDAKNIGAIWEEYEKAGPRSVNGYPMFLSFHLVHVDDIGPLLDELEKLQAALVDQRSLKATEAGSDVVAKDLAP